MYGSGRSWRRRARRRRSWSRLWRARYCNLSSLYFSSRISRRISESMLLVSLTRSDRRCLKEKWLYSNRFLRALRKRQYRIAVRYLRSRDNSCVLMSWVERHVMLLQKSQKSRRLQMQRSATSWSDLLSKQLSFACKKLRFSLWKKRRNWSGSSNSSLAWLVSLAQAH